MLASLLPLLRSGGLQSLLGSGSSLSQPSLPKRKKAEDSQSPQADSGWKAAKPTKTKAQPAATSVRSTAAGSDPQVKLPVTDTLVQEGFSCEGHSVKVLQSVADIKVDVASVCLATRQEAHKAKMEINAQVPIALLTPVPIEEGNQLVHVAIKDTDGKVHVRRSFLFQLGRKPVRFMVDAPQGCNVQVETEKIVLGVMQQVSPCWDAALRNPKQVFGNWLRDAAGIPSVVEIQRPNRVGDKLQAVVVLRKGSRDLCLQSSGQGGGVFSRVFVDKDAERVAAEFRTVPVPLGQDLASAVRTAGSLKQHWGIVPYGKGVGIRVAAKDFEITLAVVQPIKDAVKFIGDTFVISGVPLSWTAEDLGTFFKGKWEMSPVFSKRVGFTKTWTVRAGVAPLNSHWQHEFGLATVCERRGSGSGARRNSSSLKEPRMVWSGKPATQQKPSQPARSQPRLAEAWERRTPQRQQQQTLLQEKQQPPETGGAELSPAVLAAIQAAVSAAIMPLRQEVQEMKTAAVMEADTESEEEEAMPVDSRHKREREDRNSNVLRLRRSTEDGERPCRQQRR
jgi:hypothetical protein